LSKELTTPFVTFEGLLILELQLHYFVNDGIGPIFPVVTSYIDGTRHKFVAKSQAPFDLILTWILDLQWRNTPYLTTLID
jgi:hypothetical protein